MQLPTQRGESFLVWAKPGANKTELIGYHEGREAFEIRIAAQPTDGKANQELQDFLKKEYGVRCEIISGHTTRKKRLKIL